MPKLVPWNVLAGSSDNIRSAVAEMRRAINKRRTCFFVYGDFCKDSLSDYLFLFVSVSIKLSEEYNYEKHRIYRRRHRNSNPLDC